VTRAEPFPHLDADAVADLGEDLLDPAEATAARQHLASCLRCRELAAALDDVRGRLHQLPTETVPAAVTARLDAALAGERSAGAAASGEVAPARPVPTLHGARARAGERRSGRSGSRAPQWLAAAAAVTMLLVGGSFVVRGLELSGMDAATSGSAVQGAPESATDGGGAEDSAATPAPPAARGKASLRQRAGAPVPVLASGRRYLTSALPTQVAALLGDAASVADRAGTQGMGGPDGSESPGPRGPAAGSPFAFDADADLLGRRGEMGELGPLFGTQRLAACLDALPDSAGRRALAVDLATYAGAAAALVVLEVPTDSSITEAYVVGPGCRAGDPQVRSRAYVPAP